jgi:hypothetical protein
VPEVSFFAVLENYVRIRAQLKLLKSINNYPTATRLPSSGMCWRLSASAP